MLNNDDSYINLSFRPMSLIKYINKEDNICPNISSIEVNIDGKKVAIESIEKKDEIYDSYRFDNVILKIKKDINNFNYCKKIDVKIIDIDGYIGMASIINENH